MKNQPLITEVLVRISYLILEQQFAYKGRKYRLITKHRVNDRPQQDYDTDIYRVDEKVTRNFIWLERILIKEGETEYTEQYRQVNRKEFRELVREGRIYP